MMRFVVITLFPEMFHALTCGITGRAQKSGLMQCHFINPRDYSDNPHGYIDDKPYGGGPGMVMQYQPLAKAIAAAKAQLPNAEVIYLSPQGKPLVQSDVNHFSQTANEFILLAGRYEGIDQRVIDRHIDRECSIGDYVLSGGELAAMVMIDALTRLVPGALGNECSAPADSFMNGLLDHAHYTRPWQVDGMSVPEVLQSGDHAAIAKWRAKNALQQTGQKRPDLLEQKHLSDAENALVQELMNSNQGVNHE